VGVWALRPILCRGTGPRPTSTIPVAQAAARTGRHNRVLVEPPRLSDSDAGRVGCEVDPDGTWTSTRAVLLAATGQDLMVADRSGLGWSLWSRE